jgi:hypothetical protein
VPQNQSGCYGEEKNLTPARSQTPAVQPVAHHYTNSGIPAVIKLFKLFKITIFLHVSYWILFPCILHPLW